MPVSSYQQKREDREGQTANASQKNTPGKYQNAQMVYKHQRYGQDVQPGTGNIVPPHQITSNLCYAAPKRQLSSAFKNCRQQNSPLPHRQRAAFQ